MGETLMQYKLYYINSKSEEKQMVLKTDKPLNGLEVNDQTVLPLSKQLMDTTYHCAMTKLVKLGDDGEENLFQAQPDASIHSSYVSANGTLRDLEIPVGSYIEGVILTEDNANNLIPELTKQWGGKFTRVWDNETNEINQQSSDEYLRITYQSKKRPQDQDLAIQAQQFQNMDEYKLQTKIMETTYSDDLTLSEFKKLTRHTSNMYRDAIDTATLVSQQNGASVEIPITVDTLHNGVYQFNDWDVKRMRINGIDSVDPSNLRIEPTNHFDANINKLEREDTYLTYETKLNGFNMAKLMSNSGKVTVAPQDLKSNIFDKLRDWNNESPRGVITSLFVDLEGEHKTGDITVEWYNDSRQDESGITMNITQNNKTASYFVDNPGNNSQVRVRHVENSGGLTHSHDLASLRSCLNTIVSENAKNATIGQTLATEETVKTEKQIPDVSPQKETPSESAQLPQSIQSRLDEINNIKDNLQNLIGDDRIEQDAINTKMEHVNNAVKMYNDLFQTHTEKATTYLERFESSLDNIKAELDAKTSSYLEQDASDFEAALRMLEETDNLSQ